MRKLIYLACPYTHDNPAVMEKRFNDVTAAAARLIESGYHVYSPITHSHPIAQVGALPTDWEYWKELDEKMLRICDVMIVVMLPGWLDSSGIKAEIGLAGKMMIPVLYAPEKNVVNACELFFE